MSTSLLKQTKDDIKIAYQSNNLTKIEKETLYVFDRTVHFMLSAFKKHLKGITFKSNNINFDEDYIRSKKNMKHIYKMLDHFTQIELPLSDFDFGKLKIDLERWYYYIGGEEMYFEYQEEYLITPKEAAKSLGISNVTLNKYMKLGLESIDTSSHHKIPKHAVEVWQDPVYATRMQMLVQDKKIRNQSPEEQLKEVREGITELQKEYKAKTFLDALDKNKIDDINTLDDPSDFRKWKDLEEEEEALVETLIRGGSEFA